MSHGLLLTFEITILVLAIFLGFEVISKVPTLLHTPLMSGTNAIHGIVIVGAMLVDHLQGDEAPVDLVMPELLYLGDPTGCDPGPRAHRIEKELEIGHVVEAIGGLSMKGHPSPRR